MKDTLNRYARGEFMYDSPEVTIVSDDLEAQICVGSIQNREVKIAGRHE